MSAAATHNIGGAPAPPRRANGSACVIDIDEWRASPCQRAARANLAAALDYADAGVPIFPVAQSKQPLIRDWEKAATTDGETIARWWRQHPSALAGLPVGRANSVAIDADRHNPEHDGVDALLALLGDDLLALGAPIVETAGGGLHLFFRQPDGERLRNARGALPQGIDVRGDGGFVVAAGSVRSDGTAWRADPDSPDLIESIKRCALPQLPEALLRLIRTKPERPEPPRQRADDRPRTNGSDISDREHAFARVALDACAAELASAGAGGRNQALNAASFRMGRQIAAGRIGRAEVERQLETAAQACGLVKDDGWPSVRATIRSGIEGGMKTPADPLADRERPNARPNRDDIRFTRRDRPDEPRPGEAEGGSADQSGGEQHDPLRGFLFDGDAVPEPPKMLVKGLIGDREIAFIGGQSGAGKTFIAIDLAVSLASGEPFFGRIVKERVGVAIFASEGASTIPNRLIVAKNAKAGDEPLPIAWLGEVPDLKRPSEVAAMIPRLRAVDDHFRETFGVRLGVVVCDTLAATFNLDDEDDNSEAAQTIRIMKGLVDKLGVTVAPIHHYGKAADTGLRGASGWRAGCDSVIAILANRDQTTGRCDNRRLALSKSRVSEEGLTIPFNLRFVALGLDEDGDEYGSCYVEHGTGFNAADEVLTKKEAGPPRAARVYLDAIGVVLGEHGKKVRPFGFDGPEVSAVDRDIVRAEFYRSWPADGDTDDARKAAKRQAFKRGEDWSLKNKRAATYEVAATQMVWLLRESDQ